QVDSPGQRPGYLERITIPSPERAKHAWNPVPDGSGVAPFQGSKAAGGAYPGRRFALPWAIAWRPFGALREVERSAPTRMPTWIRSGRGRCRPQTATPRAR